MKETASDSRRRSALSTRHSALAFVALFLAVALVSSAPAATASPHLQARRPGCVKPDRSRSQFLPGEHRRHTGRHAVCGKRRHRRDPAVWARLDERRDVCTGRRQYRDRGVLVDMIRGVLWACAVDLTFQTPTALRAFDLRTGRLRATYEVPDRGVCGDITLAYDDVTSPIRPIRSPGPPGGSCG